MITTNQYTFFVGEKLEIKKKIALKLKDFYSLFV